MLIFYSAFTAYFYSEKVFKDRYNLENHVHTHTQERPYSCSLCPTTYSEKKLLTKHLKRHTKFPQQMMRKNHYESRCLICIFCSQKMKSWGNLLGHLEVHTRENHFPAKFVRNRLQLMFIWKDMNLFTKKESNFLAQNAQKDFRSSTTCVHILELCTSRCTFSLLSFW